METDARDQAPNSPLLPWAEPQISNFDVADTAFFPHTGGDGSTIAADCTRS